MRVTPDRTWPRCRSCAGIAALLAGLCFSLAAMAESSLAADPPSTVIVLSLDGVRHDQPDRGSFPALARLEREGVRATLVPVFPSSTFPSHASLATGTHPDVHGILNNRFYDPARGRFAYSGDASWFEAEPLWIAAERQGVTSAVFFWVGSETDWRGRGAHHRRTPFDSDVGEPEKVDQILAWLDLPPAERPRLVMSWWHGTDRIGHRYGPDSARIVTRLREQDAQLARLLAGIDERGGWAHTTLLLVSDHGMTRVAGGVDLAAVLREHGIAATVASTGPVATFHLEEPGQRNALAVALNAIDGVTAYAVEALPERFRFRHPTRSGDVVAIARPPTRFRAGAQPLEWLASVWARIVGSRGGHGYDPALPDMHAVFFAKGRGVPPGVRLERVRAVDVAPTVAHLLGIEPPAQSEGTPIPEISAPASAQAPAFGSPR